MRIRVRRGTGDDRVFAVDTARRLADFGPPPWRSAIEIVAAEVHGLDEFFDGRMPGCAVLIAETEDGARLGFAFVERRVDYFSGQEHGHLGMIAVTQAAEGTGAGAALLRAAEDWTRESGFGTLTLHVFEGNRRARDFYERFGYRIETLRYTKSID
jgi:GNAT superfamily N-acetyltransferase